MKPGGDVTVINVQEWRDATYTFALLHPGGLTNGMFKHSLFLLSSAYSKLPNICGCRFSIPTFAWLHSWAISQWSCSSNQVQEVTPPCIFLILNFMCFQAQPFADSPWISRWERALFPHQFPCVTDNPCGETLPASGWFLMIGERWNYIKADC